MIMLERPRERGTQVVLVRSTGRPTGARYPGPRVFRVASLGLVAVAIVAGLSAHAGAAPPPLLVPGPSVQVGPGSGHVALADVNRDGHVDLIAQHLLRRLVQVRLGDGTGGFPASRSSSLRFGYQPGAIGVGDVDEDGSPDLLVARRDKTKEYLHVLHGKVNGRFDVASASAWAVNDRFRFYKPTIRLADTNEDGKVDIVTSNGRRNTIEILLGAGPRSYTLAPVVTLPGGQDSHSYEPGDVDGDAHVDLVVVSRTEGSEQARLLVLSGDGNGSFAPASTSQALIRGGQIAALADLNRDRKLDVVLTHARSKRLSVLLNSGQGAFARGLGSPYRLPAEAFAVVVADVDRDRRPDLVATTVDTETTGFAGRLTVLLNNGRAFVRAPGSPFRTGRGAYNLAVGEVDGDGRLDVATSSFEETNIGIFLGR